MFLIVGAVFMSAAAIQARRGHVAIEAVVGLLSPRANRIRQIVVDIASLAVLRLLCVEIVDAAATRRSTENYHSGSTWGPPLWIPYSLMTVGMALLTLQLLLQIVGATSRGGTPHERRCRSACSTASQRCW